MAINVREAIPPEDNVKCVGNHSIIYPVKIVDVRFHITKGYRSHIRSPTYHDASLCINHDDVLSNHCSTRRGSAKLFASKENGVR